LLFTKNSIKQKGNLKMKKLLIIMVIFGVFLISTGCEKRGPESKKAPAAGHSENDGHNHDAHSKDDGHGH
jgi:hypothetical protein